MLQNITIFKVYYVYFLDTVKFTNEHNNEIQKIACVHTKTYLLVSFYIYHNVSAGLDQFVTNIIYREAKGKFHTIREY